MNSPKALPTQAQLCCLLRYDPETGDFYNLIHRPRSRSGPGSKAGWTNAAGYRLARIKGSDYLQHRLAFVYMTGAAPSEIDHIDGNPSNNRWNNLRPATRSQNNANAKRQSNNTSGYKGVSFSKQKGLFRAVVKFKGKQHHCGFFASAKIAHMAYLRRSKELHGEFARSE